MDFQSYLQDTAREINQEIDRFFASWSGKVYSISPKLLPLVQILAEGCQGGKRIRGSLVKLGYEFGKDHRGEMGEIIKVGAAYEIFHTAILAHDDIIDQSPLRRGKPTIYKALGGDHYAISQTIALADIGFFLAVRLMVSANFPHEWKNQAISNFAQTVISTGLGEVLDVEVPHLGGDRKEEDVISIHTLKTAQYTISGPLLLGAILAGADKRLLKVLDEFGENLGIAFQIQDDILGVYGDEKTLGKSTTSDIEEGKNTLLITQALKKATPAQRKILDQYYGHGKIGQKELNMLRQVFKDTGSLDYSRQQGVQYVERAKKFIPGITRDQKMVRILTEMADFLVERKT